VDGGERVGVVSRDLEPFSESLDDVFTRLGLPNPRLMADLLEEWPDLAGKPWVGNARPVIVKGKTLVVEATAPSMVAFLRYGVSALLESLSKRFGEGSITAIDVVPPGRL
jgi:hypothetical protein